MGRVKFSVNTEYAYLQNFKVLQSLYLIISATVQQAYCCQTVLPNIRLTGPCLSNLSSNVRCKITSNFSSGRKDSGTNTFRVEITTPLHGGKAPVLQPRVDHLPRLLPLPVLQELAQLDVERHLLPRLQLDR